MTGVARTRRRLTVAQRHACRERMQAAWAAGTFAHKRPSIRWDRWTPPQEARLRELVGGYPVSAIAARLSAEWPDTPRSVNAVTVRCTRLGLSPVLVHYNARTVGYLFGVGSKTVSSAWIARGWLQATQQVPGLAGSAWVITAAALERFIVDYRHCYDWRQMRPGRWRSLAEITWRRDPLLTADEAARYLGCARETIRRYLRAGVLTGYRRLEKTGDQQGRWLIARSALRTLQAETPEMQRLARQRAQGQAAWAGRRQRARAQLGVGA